MAELPRQSEPGPIVVMGVSGCGKSSVGQGIAEAFGVPFIEGDRLHPKANVDKMSRGIPLSDEDRWPWLDLVADNLRTEALANGGAVAACSALKRAYRDRLRDKVGGDLRFVFLKGGRALLAERMGARRKHFMPMSLLDSQLATLEDPRGEGGVIAIDVGEAPDHIIAAAIAGIVGQQDG